MNISVQSLGTRRVLGNVASKRGLVSAKDNTVSDVSSANEDGNCMGLELGRPERSGRNHCMDITNTLLYRLSVNILVNYVQITIQVGGTRSERTG